MKKGNWSKKKEKYYKTIDECEESKKNILSNNLNTISELEYDKFIDNCYDFGFQELHKYDSKIPNFINLKTYYW